MRRRTVGTGSVPDHKSKATWIATRTDAERLSLSAGRPYLSRKLDLVLAWKARTECARGAGMGLDEKALEAVRQYRFRARHEKWQASARDHSS